MRNPSLIAGLAGLVGLAACLAACSASSDRVPFTDEAPATPAQTPERSAEPVQTPQSGPDTTVSDAGSPDAPDTCKRTAPSKTCGVVPQCGCTLAETCDVSDSAGNVECVTAGTAAMGASCLGTAGCAVGLTCVYGTCHAFCDNPGSACTAAKTGGCKQVMQGSAGTSVAIPNLTVCRVACELRDVNGCGGTTAAGTGVCVLDDAGQTDCALGGTHTAGQACASNECGPGLVCTTQGSSSNGTCRKWCRVGTKDCGGTTACNSFATKVMVSGVEYAACP